MASRSTRFKAKTGRFRRSCDRDTKSRVQSPTYEPRSYKDSRQREKSTRERKHRSRYYEKDYRGESSKSRTRSRERSPHRRGLKDRGHQKDFGIVTVRTFINRRDETSGQHSPSGRSSGSLEREVDKMLTIEHHHTRRIEHYSSGGIKEVIWCPQYIRPDIKERARGGTSLLHHKCRSCRRLCFHLLGRPGTKRLCLACSGWKSKYIPEWYYHRRCKYCIDGQKTGRREENIQ